MNSSNTTAWVVAGVCCATEEHVLRKCLSGWLGETGYTFNPVTGELHTSVSLQEQELLATLRGAGFDAKRKTRIAETNRPLWKDHDVLFTAAAALLTITSMVLERAAYPEWITQAMLLTAIVVGGWKIALKAYKAIRLWALDMNVLMTVAVGGALAMGKWDEGAAVIILFSFALMLESYSTARTRGSIRSLMSASPEKASVLDGTREKVMRASEIEPGARIVIRPGERIALDGRVLDGRSEVDESPITGESGPKMKSPGDSAYAGSINQRGMLVIEVTRRYEETTLAHIVRSIESSEASRAPVQDFVDRFAAVYTPAVFAGALLVGIVPPLVFHEGFGEWSYRALVMLVIACPCALVISTPVTIVSALTGAARHGVLVKGGKYLQTMATTQTIAFDKTGTITEGRPRVTDIIPLDSMARDEALHIVAMLERYSDHHLGAALRAETDRQIPRSESGRIEDFETLPGRGVQGMIDGTMYFLGNETLCQEKGFFSSQVQTVMSRLAGEGKTAMVLGKEGQPLCVVAARDSARHHSKQTMAKLRGLGVRQLVILSGDRSAVVGDVAEEIGMDESVAGMLPHDKVAGIRELQRRYGTVAMVGDGINDGPALRAANVGIAMGISGSDAALETADVVLMSDELERLPLLIGLSRKTMHIIRQNIALALAIKVLFLGLSLTGVATLWMALLADDGAALLVIFNGLRALSPGKSK